MNPPRIRRCAPRAAAIAAWAACVAFATLTSATTALAQQAQPPHKRHGSAPSLAPAKPAAVGMSAERLELLTRAFEKEVADKALPGLESASGNPSANVTGGTSSSPADAWCRSGRGRAATISRTTEG